MKNSNVDVKEFPDGGRATLVRRYSPALTNRQLSVLQRCPHDAPGRFENGLLRPARALVRLGLLQENPTSRGQFSVTAAGAEVVHRWHSAGWAP